MKPSTASIPGYRSELCLSKPEDLIEIYSANGDLEAHVIKGLLESHGIPCLLQPYAVSSLQNIIVPGTGGVRIMVLESQAEEAVKLIGEKDHVQMAGESQGVQ